MEVPQPKDRVEVALEVPSASVLLIESGRRDVVRYLQEMLQDLRISGEADLTIRISDERARAIHPYRMWIDGRPCRVAIETPLTISEVMRGLYVNRDRLLGNRYRGSGPYDLLSRLVLSGLNIERAGTQEHASFEEIIAPPDATAIRILVHPQHDSLEEALRDWDSRMFDELGIILPPVRVDNSAALEQNEFQIQFNDLRLPRMSFGTSGAAEAVVQTLSHQLRTQAGHFLNRAVVQCSLDLLWESAPMLVDATLERFDIGIVTQVMRELLEDGISIRDARPILESLLVVEGMSAARFSVAFYSDEARASLRRSVTQKHIAADNCLYVLLLDPVLEGRLTGLDETERVRFLEAMLHGIAEARATNPTVVLLAKPELRRTLRGLIAHEFPGLPVIGYHQLSQDADIKPLGTITL